MSLRHKELSRLMEPDIQSLVDLGTPEGREIEYKSQLPGTTKEEKQEFLSDLVSFANCIGGDILFGVIEERGVPVKVPGVEIKDVDDTKLRLENMIRDSIEPRIVPNTNIHAVPLSSSRFVLILRITRSLALPHAVRVGGALAFYSRNSAGKYPLDTGEVRSAYIGSQDLIERIRRFRLERIAIISANEAPIVLPPTGKILLHIVQFRAFEPGAIYDVGNLLEDRSGKVRPIGRYNDGGRHNFDGILVHSGSGPEYIGYLQLFRNGMIEAVDTHRLRPREKSRLVIPSVAWEEDLIEATGRFLDIHRELGVAPPLAIMLTVIGAKGYSMEVRVEHYFGSLLSNRIDRNLLSVPEIVVSDYTQNIGRLMRPAFDAVWNAAGWPGSINYDSKGDWSPCKQ
ncbi:MAG: ATP-binding protein [Chloroflexi bacterium]|nr:ATP-binding protein [Chloroflexota bacterium]